MASFKADVLKMIEEIDSFLPTIHREKYADDYSGTRAFNLFDPTTYESPFVLLMNHGVTRFPRRIEGDPFPYDDLSHLLGWGRRLVCYPFRPSELVMVCAKYQNPVRMPLNLQASRMVGYLTGRKLIIAGPAMVCRSDELPKCLIGEE